MVTESIIENIIICNPKQVEVSSGAVEFRGVCGTGYAKYFGIDNGKKADLINLSEPIQKVLQIPVNKDLRNGIGHNNYKYDGLMQTITTFFDRQHVVRNSIVKVNDSWFIKYAERAIKFRRVNPPHRLTSKSLA